MSRPWSNRRVIKWMLTAVWLLGAAATALTFVWAIPLGHGLAAAHGEVWRHRSDTSLGVFPLSDVVTALAIPVMALWILDQRKDRPGDCRCCGYDLTGNVSGVCPECGTKVSEPA